MYIGVKNRFDITSLHSFETQLIVNHSIILICHLLAAEGNATRGRRADALLFSFIISDIP